MTAERWLMSGALSAAVAVICGAFAAHDLNTRLPKLYEGQTKVVVGETVPAARKYLDDFKTAAAYQMYHALGMLIAGSLALSKPSKRLNAAGWCFLFGTLFFSGSLYVLVLSGKTWLGAITPIGGVLFIVGWVLLAVSAGRRQLQKAAT